MTARATPKEFFQVRSIGHGPCQAHDWPDAGLASRLLTEVPRRSRKGGFILCVDCIARAGGSIHTHDQHEERARPEPTVEVWLTVDEWSALRELMERSQGNMEWSLRIVVGEAVCAALAGGDVMAFRTVPMSIKLPKTPEARLRRPAEPLNQNWPTKGKDDPLPEAPQWPDCDWCRTEGKKTAATHIHMHKELGEKCAHFACEEHAKEDDGAHIVHVIGQILGNLPGQPGARDG